MVLGTEDTVMNKASRMSPFVKFTFLHEEEKTEM